MDKKYLENEKKFYKTVGLRIPKAVYKEYQDYAEHASISMSELLRRAVRYYIDNGLI